MRFFSVIFLVSCCCMRLIFMTFTNKQDLMEPAHQPVLTLESINGNVCSFHILACEKSCLCTTGHHCWIIQPVFFSVHHLFLHKTCNWLFWCNWCGRSLLWLLFCLLNTCITVSKSAGMSYIDVFPTFWPELASPVFGFSAASVGWRLVHYVWMKEQLCNFSSLC